MGTKEVAATPHIATYLCRDDREKENFLKTTQCMRRKGKNNVASKTALILCFNLNSVPD